MSDFKSWLVANIELLLIILTVILLVVAGIIMIPKGLADESGMPLVSFIAMAITSSILCAMIVFCIRNGFLSLVILTFFVGSVILGNMNQSEDIDNKGVEVAMEQKQEVADNEINEFEIIMETAAERFEWGWLIWLSIPALAFGVYTAVYANRNFDDVVSRRFLYRNSNVSVFEQRWKYTLNRLYAGFMTVFAIGLELMLVIILRP